ncbi:hypothetical protein EZ428_21615 [Pedobacter frigiditerrae]|uniref:Uncharacterized protein n=1 Tax=Pedobacter frigiditerrae TaxID=2530452 RepID=A0A4R0MMA0_9SPHI|nr:tail fiber protein [Pedobacter frigiditerrae]TCC87302.1 hypothetical protein EZ428_21615 [Pedobacter frigiditerrae]
MKITVTVMLGLLSFGTFAQSNVYPTTGTPIIYDYSPGLTLQRNTANGGFTQGIQTKLQNGDNNWFFGNLDNGQWMVAKGDYQYPRFTVMSNGNVGVGVNTPSYKLHVNGDIAIPYTARLLSDLDAGNNIAIHDGNGLMKFATAGQDRLVIANAGNVGIGTTAPQAKLHVTQSAMDQPGLVIQGTTINADAAQHYVALTLDGDYGNGTGNYSQIRSYSNLYSQWGSRLAFFTTSNAPANTLVERMRIDANGNVGVGTTSPTGILELQKLNSNLAFDLSTNGLSKIVSKGWNASIDMHTFQVNGTENLNQFNINTNGNVGVGTATPNEKLAVNGKIRAKEIKVEPNPASWPDYVFEADYNITSLTALEKYIRVNKHLPEMPTAKEVAVNGVELGEMNRLLLKKVEELTLHLIEKDKQLQDSDKRLSKLEAIVQQMVKK